MCAALACAALVVTSTAAFAFHVPGHIHSQLELSLVSAVLRNSDGVSVVQAQTDANGQLFFKNLAPGDYEIDIDGPSLVAAMDRLAPPAKSEGPSVGLSVGGFLGGGSSHSSSGHEGEGHDHDSHSSGGGMGVGVSVPVGGGGVGMAGIINGHIQAVTVDLGSLGKFSSETP
jgi:hypothetical protein